MSLYPEGKTDDGTPRWIHKLNGGLAMLIVILLVLNIVIAYGTFFPYQEPQPLHVSGILVSENFQTVGTGWGGSCTTTTIVLDSGTYVFDGVVQGLQVSHNYVFFYNHDQSCGGALHFLSYNEIHLYAPFPTGGGIPS